MALKIDKSITSEQNAVFRSLRDCLTSKGIKKHGEFIISGERAVRDTLERYPQLARSLLVCSHRHVNAQDQAGSNPLRAFVTHAMDRTKTNEPRFSVMALSPELFDELDVSGTKFPMLVLRTPEIEQADLTQAPNGLEILCALGDPSNVGALLRTAAAFGASRVILLKESASPLHPKAVRAASASTLAVPLAHGPSIKDLAELSSARSIVALDMKGEPLSHFKWPKDARLLMGEEGPGVPASTPFKHISIPMTEGVESLNATIASSIAIYSYRLAFPLA